MNMRISASVSSLQAKDLAPSVSQLDKAGVNFYHLDSIEDSKIFVFAKKLRNLTKTPFDLHLITSDPVKYWDEIRAHKIEEVTIQLETLKTPFYVPADLRSRVGVAVLANRPAEYFRLYMEDAPSLLLMTTTPGKSGGKFQQEQFANIMRYRILYPDVPITVDGGVIPEVSSVLSFMGISQIVSGSYLFKGSSVYETVGALRKNELADWRLDEVILADLEILHQFEFRLPEEITIIKKDGSYSQDQIKNDWLSELNAKTVPEPYYPYPLIWAEEEINLSVLKESIDKLDFQPWMVIALDSSKKISGVFYLSQNKKTE